jgi:glycosyltransferase involved in cell wall biosynthesis
LEAAQKAGVIISGAAGAGAGICGTRSRLRATVKAVSTSMKVCYFITRYSPIFSGQAIQLERIGRQLKKKGVKFFIISYRFSGLSDYEEKEGVPIHRISPSLPGKLGTALFNIRSFLAMFKFRNDFDILHVHSIAIGKYGAMLAARMMGKKTVFEMTLVDSDDPKAIKKHSPAPAVEMSFFGMFDKYFAISEALAESYEGMGLPKDKLWRLAKGVDTDLYAPPPDKRPIRRELGLPEDPPLVVFVGAVMVRKGVDVLMEAWKKVAAEDSEAVLVVVGPDTFDEVQRHLNDFARDTKEMVKRELEGRVVFTGMTDKVPNYLRASDIYCFPSRAEGMPASPLEALSCGLPVVLAPMQGIAEQVIDNGKSGIIVPQDDAGALADALLGLLRDRARAAELGAAARERALERFSVEKAAEALIGYYNEMLSE